MMKNSTAGDESGSHRDHGVSGDVWYWYWIQTPIPVAYSNSSFTKTRGGSQQQSLLLYDRVFGS
jgi:hypothetical protein